MSIWMSDSPLNVEKTLIFQGKKVVGGSAQRWMSGPDIL